VVVDGEGETEVGTGVDPVEGCGGGTATVTGLLDDLD
jgi:hypothetical protein